MKRSFFLIVSFAIILSYVTVHAQTPPGSSPTPADTFGWKQSLSAMLTLTQSSYKDWVAGGDDAFAFNTTLDGKTTDDERNTRWTTTYHFGFGKTSLNDVGTRKTSDVIDVQSVYSYKFDSLLNPYISATLLTQFAPGFTYDDSNRATQVSKFFDPAFLTQGAGIGFLPWIGVKERLGVALREIVTSQFTQYANVAGGPQTNKVKVEGGLQSMTDLNWILDSNVVFTANLSLFAPFKTMDQIVVYSTNSITAKVSKYVSVGFAVQFINERDISPRTQISEGLGLNLSYTLL